MDLPKLTLIAILSSFINNDKDPFAVLFADQNFFRSSRKLFLAILGTSTFACPSPSLDVSPLFSEERLSVRWCPLWPDAVLLNLSAATMFQLVSAGRGAVHASSSPETDWVPDIKNIGAVSRENLRINTRFLFNERKRVAVSTFTQPIAMTLAMLTSETCYGFVPPTALASPALSLHPPFYLKLRFECRKYICPPSPSFRLPFLSPPLSPFVLHRDVMSLEEELIQLSDILNWHLEFRPSLHMDRHGSPITGYQGSSPPE